MKIAFGVAVTLMTTTTPHVTTNASYATVVLDLILEKILLWAMFLPVAAMLGLLKWMLETEIRWIALFVYNNSNPFQAVVLNGVFYRYSLRSTVPGTGTYQQCKIQNYGASSSPAKMLGIGPRGGSSPVCDTYANGIWWPSFSSCYQSIDEAKLGLRRKTSEDTW